MSKWQFTKGLHDVGNGIWAYLQPDGSWGFSNAGLIVEGGQTLLIDTLFDLKLTGEMLETMRRSVPAAARIDTLVNTHANGDHCFGNELVSGAQIIATQATLTEMGELPPELLEQLIADAGKLGPGAAFIAELFAPFEFKGIKLRKPDRTFCGELELKIGDKVVQLIEVGPAHTRGDTLVYVPGDRVVFTGDILFHEGTPIAWSGPVHNWIRACERILDMDVEVVVPGHGGITDKRGVAAMRSCLEYVTGEARKRFENGMSALDAAFDIALGPYAKWGDAERIVVTVNTLYGEFGKPPEVDRLTLFAQMARMRGAARE